MRRIPRVRILVLVVLPIALASVAGGAYAGWPQAFQSASQDVPRGAVPVTDENWQRELQAASSRVGFDPLVPTSFPTDATALVLVDASVGPPGATNGLRLIELVYRGSVLRKVDGIEFYSMLEMFQTNVRLSEANGERIASDVAGYELHRDIVSSDVAGNPVKVTYTARSDERTFVMDFTGEQPTEHGLDEMLRSLQLFR